MAQTIIDLVDNYRFDHSGEPLLKFVVPSPSKSGAEVTIGWIRESVLPHIRSAPDVFIISSESDVVRFESGIDSFEKRSAAVASLCAKWRDEGLFNDTIGPKKWRDELYPVYFDPFQRTWLGGKEVAFAIERTCCALFGLAIYVRLFSSLPINSLLA